MSGDGTVLGDEPLVDGMKISVRIRRDFVVANASEFLDAARRAFLTLHPDTTPELASEIVSSAADALFAILECDGLLGEAVDARLSARKRDGLNLGGWRAQVIVDEPGPLPPFPTCFDLGDADVFALPASET